MTSSAAAEMARNATTPHPVRKSNRWWSRVALPGGPVMKVAVTGSAKPLVSTAMSTAWTASTRPTTTFHQRSRSRRRSVSRSGAETASWASVAR